MDGSTQQAKHLTTCHKPSLASGTLRLRVERGSCKLTDHQRHGRCLGFGHFNSSGVAGHRSLSPPAPAPLTLSLSLSLLLTPRPQR